MTIRTLALAASAALCLSGCAGLPMALPSANSTAAAKDAFSAFLADPNCAHHDEAHMVIGAGGVPGSFRADAVRDCAARNPAPTPAAAAALVTPGL